LEFIMVTRSTVQTNNAEQLRRVNGSHPKGKASSTAKPEQPQPQAAKVEETESLYDRAHAAMEDLLGSISMPSWTRRLASTLLSVTMSAVVAYGCLSLVDALVLATAAYTGSQFLTFCVMFIGVVLTMMAAMTAATKVFEVAMEFEYSAVKTRVSNWFGGFRKPANT
jgi:hypothetical protein